MNGLFRTSLLTRRRFLKRTGVSTLPIVTGAFGWHTHGRHRLSAWSAIIPDELRLLADHDQLKELAKYAIQVATDAGATYAEAHFSRIVRQTTHGIDNTTWESGQVEDQEELGFGIRCIANGAWGFASNPFWSRDDIVRTAHSAVAYARAGATSSGSAIVMAPLNTVPSGSWRTPVEIDPFTVPLEERQDFAQAFELWCSAYEVRGDFSASCRMLVPFVRSELVTATSEGAVFSQTVYTIRWTPGLQVLDLKTRGKITIPFHVPAGCWRGWEVMRDAKLTEQVGLRFEEGKEILRAGARALEVGRYTVVFDGATMGSLLGQTIGKATEADRILGYEANASGTSFLGFDPMDILGKTRTGSRHVTITANRTLPGGLATVQWDAEGVAAQETTLVNEGVVTDLQTTRELATELGPYYETVGKSSRSNGCASSASALAVPIAMRPNLTLQSGREDLSLDALVRNVDRGLAVLYGGAGSMDFQGRTGFVNGCMREIIKGKLQKVVYGMSCMINSASLWKDVTAIGGPHSIVTTDHVQQKGEPSQETSYSIQAVPATIDNVALIDPYRRW